VTERSRRDRHSATKAQRNPAAWTLPGTAAGYHQLTLSKNLSNAAGDAERSAVNSEASSMHGKAKLPVSSAEGPHGGHRMAMIGDCRAPAWSSFDVAPVWESTSSLPPRGGPSFGPPLSALFRRTERMRRTLVASGERE
jgi:hypothetical protein